jgi:hypothetical protein
MKIKYASLFSHLDKKENQDRTLLPNQKLVKPLWLLVSLEESDFCAGRPSSTFERLLLPGEGRGYQDHSPPGTLKYLHL